MHHRLPKGYTVRNLLTLKMQTDFVVFSVKRQTYLTIWELFEGRGYGYTTYYTEIWFYGFRTSSKHSHGASWWAENCFLYFIQSSYTQNVPFSCIFQGNMKFLESFSETPNKTLTTLKDSTFSDAPCLSQRNIGSWRTHKAALYWVRPLLSISCCILWLTSIPARNLSKKYNFWLQILK